MTWAEFKIRLYAHQRIQKAELYKTREICYQIYISNYYGKSKPMSKDAYWPIESSKPVVTDKMRERIRKAQEQYKKDLENVK